jgi:hypothetical protein
VLGGVKFTKKPNLTNVYPNNNKNNKKKKNNNNNNKNNKVKSKPLELFELAGKNQKLILKIAILKKEQKRYTV